MANLSIAAFLSKWATKFATNGTGAITGAFMREFRQDLADSFLSLNDGITETSVDVSGATFTLDFNSKWEKLYYGSASFATAKELLIINETNAKKFLLAFEITNVAAELTLPSNFALNSALWERTSDNTWSPLDIGKYLMRGIHLNGEWKVEIDGPWL